MFNTFTSMTTCKKIWGRSMRLLNSSLCNYAEHICLKQVCNEGAIQNIQWFLYENRGNVYDETEFNSKLFYSWIPRFEFVPIIPAKRNSFAKPNRRISG